jgi:hypothetical protein
MSQYPTDFLIGPQGPGNPLQTVGPYGPIKTLTSNYDSDKEDKPTHHWKYIGEELVRDYRAAMTALPMARPCKSGQSKDGYRAAIEHCLATAEDRFLTRNRDWAKWIVKVEALEYHREVCRSIHICNEEY